MKKLIWILLFLAAAAPGALAESGEETIVWKKEFKGYGYGAPKFSHNNQLIGFSGIDITGVMRTSDGTILWRDSIPLLQNQYAGMSDFGFSKDDSLFAYVRYYDNNIYIKNSRTGAAYRTISISGISISGNGSPRFVCFIDSSRILVKASTTYLVDFKNSVIIDSMITNWYGCISKAGNYLFEFPNTKIQGDRECLRRIYHDSIGKSSLDFSGNRLPSEPALGEMLYPAFSYDDKIMALMPSGTYGVYLKNRPVAIYNMESLSCQIDTLFDIILPGSAFIDVDKKHLILNARQKDDISSKRDNFILSLDDLSVSNRYNIWHSVFNYALAITDATTDSLYYVGIYLDSIASGKKAIPMVVLYNAVRTPTGIPPIFKPGGGIKIYPNPLGGSGQILSIEGIEMANSVSISDERGNEFFKSGIQSSDKYGIKLELPSLTKGVYFITIVDIDGKKTTKKLMIGEK